MNFPEHESTGCFSETRHRVESSTSGRAFGKPRNSARQISIRPKSLPQRSFGRTTLSVSHVAPVMQKTEEPVEFRNKHMKPRISINEMSRKQTDVVLWRRFGCGGWFLVQTASQASDRRNHRLVRSLRAPEMRRPRMGF
jgi:hypothetical protein